MLGRIPDRKQPLMSSTGADDLTVYTAIIGDGYDLPEVQSEGSRRFVCFTDQADLEPRGWQVQQVQPMLPLDATRSAREVKIRPHRWITTSRSIYIDPSVTLTADPEAVWDLLVGGDPRVEFAALKHSFRSSVRDEFAVCEDSGLENAFILQEHLSVLEQSSAATLDERPIWTGLLARRHHSPQVTHAMETWWAHVLRYSRRDQLSINTAIRLLDSSAVRVLDHDNHGSPVHSWPRPTYRRPDRYYESARARFAHVSEELDRHRAAVETAQLEAEAARRSEAAALARAEAATSLAESLNAQLERLSRRRVVRMALRVVRPLRPLFRWQRAASRRSKQVMKRGALALKGFWWLQQTRRHFSRATPKTYAEKIRYKMAFDHHPLLPVFADKVAMREYVERRVGAEYLPRLVTVINDPRELRLRDLPDQCAVKPSHGSGAIILIDDTASPRQQLPAVATSDAWTPLNVRAPKSSYSDEWLRTVFSHWNQRNYAFVHGWYEWAYRRVKPQILVEELLPSRRGEASVRDIKVLVAHGVACLILIESGRGTEFATRNYFTPTGKELDWRPQGFTGPRLSDALPQNLERILRLAERLAEEVDFVRVDLFEIDDRIIVGELTNYPAAGARELLDDAGVPWVAPEWRPFDIYPKRRVRSARQKRRQTRE